MTLTHRSPTGSPPGLALFDLDNTLLPIDSDSAWASYLISTGVFEREFYERENERFYQQYLNGTLNIHAFLAFVFSPLVGKPIELLEQWRADYFKQCIGQHVRAEALALVQEHQRAGDLCAIVTATNSFVTAPIAKAFGVEHLIGTDLEIVNNSFTGKARGEPSFREGKITRTEQWLAARGKSLASYQHSWFYSDSINDLPLLNCVTNPVAVHPDAKLLAHALDKAWPVLKLFGDKP